MYVLFCFVCIWSGGGNIFIVITGVLLDLKMEKDRLQLLSWFCLLRFMKEVTSALTKEIRSVSLFGVCMCVFWPA